MMVLYWQRENVDQNMEGFVSEPTFFEGPYIPDTINNLIYMYLSSFSDTTSDNISPVYEAGGSAYWRDLKEGKELFNLIGTNLPPKLRNPPTYGIPMMGVRMIGPPSENFAAPNSGYILPSISICFFGKWKSINLDAPLVLFRMYAETPNAISVTYTPIENDTNNVKLSIILGATTNVYEWVIPKTSLLTQSIGTLYCFIFDRDANTITCSVGTTNLGVQNLKEKPVIKLSNSPMEIAYTQNWDFQLQAVLLCRGVITPSDITASTDYFANLSNGKVQEILELEQEATQAKKKAETCSSKLPRLLAQIDNLKGEVMYNEREIKELAKKLEREKVLCSRAAVGDKKFQWLIKNGKCPQVRPPPKGINEFPHLMRKITVRPKNAPSIPQDGQTATISPPTTTSTFKHAIAPVGSSEHQSWLSKWIPFVNSQ